MEQELLNGLHATFNSFKQNEHEPMYNNQISKKRYASPYSVGYGVEVYRISIYFYQAYQVVRKISSTEGCDSVTVYRGGQPRHVQGFCQIIHFQPYGNFVECIRKLQMLRHSPILSLHIAFVDEMHILCTSQRSRQRKHKRCYCSFHGKTDAKFINHYSRLQDH